ncbi:alkaline ceramidase [Myriangium duriaei CBS 260.36]|uniref:Alkaline ceramidase n=1 Tax=Myriangium duriaei CBS 260.36 TaxID=1168546 RepID=A0A9P4J608_9PEZI|nr:alkaline ceramidase [Myriangium duriaei CBS 260.36]
MPSWLPSVPYPPLKKGYWEPVTSTLNWCEEDYYATIYSAEIVNTLTNVLFQYLAFKGAYNCIKNDHDQIFLITFIGYFLVGTGSFLFHATLKYPMQLVDELSMIYTTCLMVYATFSHKKKPLTQFLLAISQVSLALFITGYYHYLQDPKFHQNMYALLTVIVLVRSMYVMEINMRPTFKKQEQAKAHLPAQERKRQEDRDRWILKTMWTMIAMGLAIFLGGFGIWNLDNIYCSKIRRWRHDLGLPWGLVLEGHGWWHLMTGTGAYFYITWGIWLRHCLNGRQDEYELVWPNKLTSLPLIVKSTKPEFQNGSAKKTL